MGKFSIGARVRDNGGDEGVIVAKRKGERLVEYDDGFGRYWNWKDHLTPIQEEPVADVAEEPWQPKVGDRVRNIGEKGFGESFPIGKGTGTVKSVYGGACDVISDLDGWVGFFFNRELEPAATPGALEEPTTTPTAKPKTKFKVGDRVRSVSDADGGPIVVGNTYTVTKVFSDNYIEFDDEDGDRRCRNGVDYELEPAELTTTTANNDNLVLTITAPNERTAALIRSYAALIECDVAS